jgi:hypothetical protein
MAEQLHAETELRERGANEPLTDAAISYDTVIWTLLRVDSARLLKLQRKTCEDK